MTAGKLKTAECEDCAVLRFWMAKDNSAAAIHKEIYSAYGQGIQAMSKKVLRNWDSSFAGGQENTQAEEKSEWSQWSIFFMHVCWANLKWLNPIAHNLFVHKS